MQRAAQLVVRVGVAFAFLYPPIDALFEPYTWFGYFPHWVLSIATTLHIPNLVLLHGFGVFEALIALWILSGKKIFIPSALATLLLCAIVLSDLSDFSVLFRDLSIAAGALALTLDSWQGKRAFIQTSPL